MASKWMDKLHLKHGALHRELGVPMGRPIPLATEEAAAKKPGKEGKRARLALIFRGAKGK